MSAETFGQRLKRLRERSGMTQVRLAAAAGVPIGTLRGAEYDRREPLVGTANKLALALGVSLDELAGRSADASAPASPETKPDPPPKAKPHDRAAAALASPKPHECTGG